MKIKPFIELCRVSNLPTVWTNVLAAILLTGEKISWINFTVLATSISLFYSGGMCLNDIFDAPVDMMNKRFRPLPSGRVSMKQAYALTGVLFAAALLLLILIPFKKAFYPGVILLGIIIVYDKFHKARPLSVLLMAACRFMIFILCAIAQSGIVGHFVLYAASIQFAYTLSISIVARYENTKKIPFIFPVIPVMIACMSLIDGIVMAIIVSPAWVTAGIIGTIVTLFWQKSIKGD